MLIKEIKCLLGLGEINKFFYSVEINLNDFVYYASVIMPVLFTKTLHNMRKRYYLYVQKIKKNSQFQCGSAIDKLKQQEISLALA